MRQLKKSQLQWNSSKTSRLIGLTLGLTIASVLSLSIASAQQAANPAQQKSARVQPISVSSTGRVLNSQDKAVVQASLFSAVAAAEPSVVAVVRAAQPAVQNAGGSGDDAAKKRADAQTPQGIKQGAVLKPGEKGFQPLEYFCGVVVDANGLIVTCYHSLGVPEKNNYWVWLAGKPYRAGRPLYQAKVLVADAWSDLAVLKIDANNLTAMPLAPSLPTKGQLAVALTDPQAISLNGSASSALGMIANLHQMAPPTVRGPGAGGQRTTVHHYGTLLVSDIRFQAGTSGAALVDTKGRLMGLTTSWSRAPHFDEAAGYAIAVDDFFRATVQQLKQGKLPQYGYLGLSTSDLKLEVGTRQPGVRISHVIAGAPAALAGVKAGDILTHLDNAPVFKASDFYRAVGRAYHGDRLTVTLQRRVADNSVPERMKLAIRLSKRNADVGRPSYSQQKPRVWRGIEIDFPTALPDELFRQRGHLIDRRGCVAVTKVAVESTAWKAGLRPGTFISQVGGNQVDSPKTFFDLVDGQEAVSLAITSDAPRTVVVPSPTR